MRERPMTHGGKNKTNQWGDVPRSCFYNSWGFVNANKSYSQPSRWKADAVINILSLPLWSPQMCVHSIPKNVSTVPMKPRHRPIIRSPLTAWMYADNTHIWVIKFIHSVVYLTSCEHCVKYLLTFDRPQHPEVDTVHQSGGVFIAVLPQVRPVPGCHHHRGAPLTPQLGHPPVRKYVKWINCLGTHLHIVFHTAQPPLPFSHFTSDPW